MLSRSWRQQPPSLLSLGGGVWFDLTCFAQSELSVAVVVTRKLCTHLTFRLHVPPKMQGKYQKSVKFLMYCLFFLIASNCGEYMCTKLPEVLNVLPFFLICSKLEKIHILVSPLFEVRNGMSQDKSSIFASCRSEPT